MAFWNPTSTIDFYHYTSDRAADQIIKSGVIMQSSSGGPDAMLGTGVYGTALTPNAGKTTIAQNNWTSGWYSRELVGHVDYAFKISVPRSSVQEYSIGGRHIYLHPGPIMLNSYQWQLFQL